MQHITIQSLLMYEYLEVLSFPLVLCGRSGESYFVARLDDMKSYERARRRIRSSSYLDVDDFQELSDEELRWIFEYCQNELRHDDAVFEIRHISSDEVRVIATHTILPIPYA